MPRNFGRHVASEISAQARTFLDHVHDASIWPAMTDKIKGRFTEAELKRGEALWTAAQDASTASAHEAGTAATTTHKADDALTAAEGWLHNQLVHVRGLLHENNDDASRAAEKAINKALSHSRAHAAVSENVRTYVRLVKGKDAKGKAVPDDASKALSKLLTASYPDRNARDATLKDGLHLADALDADSSAPAAGKATRIAATSAKNDATDKLARWLHRWALVAHNVVSPSQLTLLGLASARHHPAHRPHHPAQKAAEATTSTKT